MRPAWQGGPDDEPATSQQLCGRCRKVFTERDVLQFATCGEWWLCDPCRTALFHTAVGTEG